MEKLNIHEKSGVMIAWIGLLFHFLTQNYNVILSVLCALGALTASIYSISASRSRKKLFDSELEELRRHKRQKEKLKQIHKTLDSEGQNEDEND